jgi:hypothetical protein
MAEDDSGKDSNPGCVMGKDCNLIGHLGCNLLHVVRRSHATPPLPSGCSAEHLQLLPCIISQPQHRNEYYPVYVYAAIMHMILRQSVFNCTVIGPFYLELHDQFKASWIDNAYYLLCEFPQILA